MARQQVTRRRMSVVRLMLVFSKMKGRICRLWMVRAWRSCPLGMVRVRAIFGGRFARLLMMLSRNRDDGVGRLCNVLLAEELGH
jgi:hypothetical protein